MSLFNAPEELPNHQEAATAAAAECLVALFEKNKEWKAKYGVEMAFRTGINSGEVLIKKGKKKEKKETREIRT